MGTRARETTHDTSDPVLERDFRKGEMKWLGLDDTCPPGALTGLALSGGGVRSAIFNLGILQSFHRRGLMKHIHYLSTVSGGGYIGTCYTWLMHTLNRMGDTCGHAAAAGEKPVGARVVDWLRNNGNYLAPGGGYTVWTLLAAVLSGILINLAILVPVFLVIFHLLLLPLPFFFPVGAPAPVMTAINSALIYVKAETLMQLLPLVCLIAGGAFSAGTVFQALTSFGSSRMMRRAQNRARMLNGVLLKITAASLVMISVQLAAGWLATRNLHDCIHQIALGIQAVGSLSFLVSFFKGSAGPARKAALSIVSAVSFLLLVFGLLLLLYTMAASGDVPLVPALAWLGISLVASLFIDINNYSLHRYYRDRLLNAFMPFRVAGASWSDADGSEFQNISRRPKSEFPVPFPIVNTAVNTIDSNDPKNRNRGSENFVFTPVFCGSRSTRYLSAKEYIGGHANLATAMAVSGAAVDPNSIITRSRPLSFLMAFFNIRLGYWIRNPKRSCPLLDFSRPMAQWYMLKEMLGFGLNEDRFSIHLSDGGHFENLGVYELLRRRCGLIIASDATADKNHEFRDLGKLVELARVDLDTVIDFTRGGKSAVKNGGFPVAPVVTAEIRYPARDGFPASRGTLVYINTMMMKGLSADILSYKERNPDFPDQTTADQFFDEEQFEAYRALGEAIGDRVQVSTRSGKIFITQ